MTGGAGPARPQGGRSGQPAGRRRRDLRGRSARPRCARPRSRGSGGSRCTSWRTAGAQDQRHHALRPRGDATRTGSTTCSGCARPRTRPAASRPSSRWPSSRSNTRAGRTCPGTTGVDDLKTLAVARLLLDNFDHIKTYWVMTGLKLAQVRPVLRRERHGRHRGGGGHLPAVGRPVTGRRCPRPNWSGSSRTPAGRRWSATGSTGWCGGTTAGRERGRRPRPPGAQR